MAIAEESKGSRLEPVMVREFRYQMPESNGALEDIRSTLEKFSQTSNSEKLLVRIEKISSNPSDQQEEIEVSFWKASEMPAEEFFGFFKVARIC